jgi:formate dehydrogenase subunit delta
MSSVDRLVQMANQIAANLTHETDPAAATAKHIQLFWDPRMKSMIRNADQSGLSAIARDAIDRIAQSA